MYAFGVNIRNQHFMLKNQKNWLKQVSMLKFWSVINYIFVHWTKKLTLEKGLEGCGVFNLWVLDFINKIIALQIAVFCELT